MVNKTINKIIVANLVLIIVLVLNSTPLAACPCNPECGDNYCGIAHDWTVGSAISVDIVREHSQTWHEVGVGTQLWANAEDEDEYYCCVDETTYYPTDTLVYSWSGSYLVAPTNVALVTWYPTNYTPTTITVSVTVSDEATMIECDEGTRNDVNNGEDSVSMGAFQAKASLVVSGSNNGGGSTAAYELEYYDYTNDPCFEPAAMKEISISLDSNTLDLGNYNDDTVISPNPSTETLSMVTSQADWTMACVPSGKWSADMDGTVSCKVDRVIDGNLVSNVWDDDADLTGVDVSISVSFGSPISISISKTFDLDGDAARSQVAIGFGYQSEVAFVGTGYEGETEHKDDSNAHSYTGETPYNKISSIDASSAEKTFTANRDGDKTAQMKTQTEGWIKMIESKEWIPTGPYPMGYWSYHDAYVDTYQEGTATYKVGYPGYSGTKHNNENWPF